MRERFPSALRQGHRQGQALFLAQPHEGQDLEGGPSLAPPEVRGSDNRQESLRLDFSEATPKFQWEDFPLLSSQDSRL